MPFNYIGKQKTQWEIMTSIQKMTDFIDSINHFYQSNRERKRVIMNIGSLKEKNSRRSFFVLSEKLNVFFFISNVNRWHCTFFLTFHSVESKDKTKNDEAHRIFRWFQVNRQLRYFPSINNPQGRTWLFSRYHKNISIWRAQ